MSMNFSPLIGMYLVTAMVAASSSEAAAQLSLFQYEMQAQLHCPDDAVVWLDCPKRIYYVAGQRLYAQGRTGFRVSKGSPLKRLPPLSIWSSLGPGRP